VLRAYKFHLGWQDNRNAPAPGTLLCQLETVPDGGCHEVRFGPADSAFCVLLFRRGVDVRAYVNSCPHFSMPLNAHPDEFILLQHERIMCAWHCAVFRLQDGHCIEGPAQGMGLDPVPVELLDGQLLVGG